MGETFDQVRSLIAKEFQLDPSTIRPDSSLADLGVDSLAALELAFEIESAFGITLDQSTDLRGATVTEVVAVLDAARAGPANEADREANASESVAQASVRSTAD